MKSLVALVFMTAVATATPAPGVIAIELDRDQIGYHHFLNPLPLSDAEPGGLIVPQNPPAHWVAMGFRAGDVIRYIDGQPAEERILIRDGINMFELVRGGKSVIMRVLVHGPAIEQSALKETDFADILKRLADPDPHSTMVTKNGAPSGVRITDLMLHFDLELAIGDIVRTIDGKPIRSDAELVSALQSLRVGRTDIALERYGRAVTIELTRQAPSDFSKIKKLTGNRFEVPKAIVDTLDTDPWLMSRKAETVPVVANGAVQGVRVYKLETDSLLAALGFLDDDIILDVDGHPVASLEEALSTAHELAGATTVPVHVQRKGKKLTHTYVIR
jgi:S1-C subfamily serine protease